ncbi:MAG: non-canonical purine NTP pyrophosphatase [Candidatus Nanohaloarchaea archaeon]
MTDTIYLITSNSDKLSSAKKAFKKTNIEIKQLDKNYNEIQASNSMEIARHTVEQIIEDIDEPVIREDHSLYLDAVPGFPGPYISYFDQEIPAEKLLELINGKKRTGYFEVGTVLGLPNGEIKEYQFKVPIKISDEIRGDERNWDRVLMLEDSDKTFAESSSESRIEIWNQNFRKIAEEFT